jgi:hypothetical protein
VVLEGRTDLDAVTDWFGTRTELDALAEAIDALGEVDPLALADTDSIERLLRESARIEAIVTRAGAAFDASGNWVADGARTAAAWLAARCRLPKAQAKRLIRRGRELRHLPVVAEAWSQGAITAAQVDVMTPLRSPATEEALARDEELLVEQAISLPYRLFVRSAAYWKQLADPDGAESDDEARRARRDVYLESSFGGMWLGRVTLDPISGATVSGELERLENRCSRPTGRRPRPLSDVPRLLPIWRGRRVSVGPTLWSRWRRAAGSHRRTASAPLLSSAC